MADQPDLPLSAIVTYKLVQVVKAAFQSQKLIVHPRRQSRSALVIEDEVVVPGKLLNRIEVLGIAAIGSNMKLVALQFDKSK